MIMFLAGPPKAGKTTIISLLKRALEKRKVSYFIERLSPDCEGSWTFESPDGFERARALKNILKTRGQFFTPEFVNFKIESLTRLSKVFPLVIGDLGGVPSKENKRLVLEGGNTKEDVLVILYREAPEVDKEIFKSWVKFAQELGIKFTVVENKFNSTTVEEILSLTNVNVSTVGRGNEKKKEEKNMLFIEITVTRNGGVIQPTELEELVSELPTAGGTEGVIIGGRLPVWGYAAIVHYFHARPWVGTYEPRQGKGVVVMSHTSQHKVGDLVDIPQENEWLKIQF